MNASDYGPVPVSRLKQESGRVFEALEGGRRVLISRHGSVVVAIEPASVTRHAIALAKYALSADEDRWMELTAKEISQGSPSEFIHAAEDGKEIWVTRNNKVYGVLGAIKPEGSIHLVDEQEEALSKFELENPDATPEEFAALVAQWTPTETVGESSNVPHSSSTKSHMNAAMRGTSSAMVKAFVEALHAKGVALEAGGEPDLAAQIFREVIDRFADHANIMVKNIVTRTMVDLANLYNDEVKPDKALAAADAALQRLEPMSDWFMEVSSSPTESSDETSEDTEETQEETNGQRHHYV